MTRNGGGKLFAQIAFWLAVVGAVNWGLVGILNFDLVRAIFGGETGTPASGLSRIIYAIVGLCGVALAALGPRLRSLDAPRLGPGRTAEVRP